MNSTFFKNINNWQDFDDKLSSLGNKEKGANFYMAKYIDKEIDYDYVWTLKQ